MDNSFASRRTARRDVIELLRRRAGLLAADDRALLETALDSGRSVRQIARLTKANPSTIARQLRRIAARLTDETFFCCLRHRGRFRCGELAILRDHFVRGRSVAQISRNRNLSAYRVRCTIRKARRLAARESTIPNPKSAIERKVCR